MKNGHLSIKVISIFVLLSAFSHAVTAQEKTLSPAPSLEALQEKLNSMEAQFLEMQRMHREQIEALQNEMDRLRQAQQEPEASQPDEQALEPETVETVPPGAVERAGAAPGDWSPADPISVYRGSRGYLNLSFSGLFAAGASTAEEVETVQPGAHDPNQRGFTVQNLELGLEGAVDPYFRAEGYLIFPIDSEGESFVEVEEAFLETLSLPANLQVRAGQYFTEFGRHNPTHPHSWGFVDMPLVNARFFGGDGLRNPGARVSWLAPTPFYSELFLSVQNSQGETAHSFRSDHEEELFLGRRHESGRVSGFEDLLWTPRYAVSLDLTENQSLLFGTSAAFGPNASGRDTHTQIYGVDSYWKWQSPTQSGGFPFVSWQTEAMLRRYEAGAFEEDADGDGINEIDLDRNTLTDYGLYSQVSYGFTKGWVAALRGDYVTGESVAFDPDPDWDTRWRISPNLTWYPSEYSKIRLQYNYDRLEEEGTEHSVWLQFEFLMGAHGGHPF